MSASSCVCVFSKLFPLMDVPYTTTERKVHRWRNIQGVPGFNRHVILVDDADWRFFIDLISIIHGWISYSTDVVALFYKVLFFNDCSM